jgi:hypothetical protein
VITELRIYSCVPGRMPDVLARFRDSTSVFFAKHGIEVVGYWTVLVGESSRALYYMLKWESLADRETRWNAFSSDPEWLEVRRVTEANGPIVESVSNTLLSPTDFSPTEGATDGH